jgi:hypothetical protein
MYFTLLIKLPNASIHKLVIGNIGQRAKLLINIRQQRLREELERGVPASLRGSEDVQYWPYSLQSM